MKGLPALVYSILFLFVQFSMSIDDGLHGEMHFQNLLQHLNLRKNIKEKSSLLQFIVNPYSQILLCDFHYGYTDMPGWDMIVVLNPLLNVSEIEPYEIVCCQSTAFTSFADYVIPKIKVPFILMTGSFKYGHVVRSNCSDAVRQNKYVLHWYSQDPVYETSFGRNGYSGFPYGILDAGLEDYALVLQKRIPKKIVIPKYLPLGANHPVRAILNMTRTAATSMSYSEFYHTMAEAEYVLSPRGDRPECYRHWESIGLGTIPISDLDATLYGHMFHGSMKFVDNTTSMLKFMANGTMNEYTTALHKNYLAPKRDIITLSYWVQHVSRVVKNLGGTKVPGMFVLRQHDGTERWVGGRDPHQPSPVQQPVRAPVRTCTFAQYLLSKCSLSLSRYLQENTRT